MASNTDLPRPFTVEYDPDEEKYFIFAPVGCVLVNGEAAKIVDAENGNVTLDIDPDDLPDYLYAHVSVCDDWEYAYKVEFDGEETKDGAKWNIRVVRFGADDNDGNSYDILASAINLGGSGGNKGPFEPMFDEDGLLIGCEYGMFPFGRQFYECADIDDGAKVATGFIGLEITHPVGSYNPTARVILVAEAPTAIANTDLTKTVLPLYYIKDSAIEADYRCLLALAVRE